MKMSIGQWIGLAICLVGSIVSSVATNSENKKFLADLVDQVKTQQP